MFGSARIKTKDLAGLCRRLGTALEAGIDIRKALASEVAGTGRRAVRSRLQGLSEAVHGGGSLDEALAATGSFFPPMFRQLVEVGEQTGHLAEVLLRLADHYDNQVRIRRMFLGAITWPLAQLFIAVVIVGLLIWIVGMIGDRSGMQIDPLGLGLVGGRGLMIYAAFVGTVALVVFALVRAAGRGVVWTRPIQRVVLRLPVLGTALNTLALARMAWALNLTLNTEMDVRRALALSIESTQNARFTDRIAAINAAIAEGSTITEALADTRIFPSDFVAAVGVGEQTGKLAESMGLLSYQYQDRARAALATLTVLAGFAVWLSIAAIIIALIFRLALFYVGTIYDAMNP